MLWTRLPDNGGECEYRIKSERRTTSSVMRELKAESRARFSIYGRKTEGLLTCLA
jgi:hypothetical protein